MNLFISHSLHGFINIIPLIFINKTYQQETSRLGDHRFYKFETFETTISKCVTLCSFIVSHIVIYIALVHFLAKKYI